jgi:hypothetical protein
MSPRPDDLEIGDVKAVKPPVGALLGLAEEDFAS